MPIYEYKCRQCEHAFEQLVRSAEEDKKMTCPDCGSTEVERCLSVFAARDGGGAGGSAPDPQACQRCCGEAGGSCPFQQ